MPWSHRVTESVGHNCERPEIGDAGVGSIWYCDSCTQRWQVERIIQWNQEGEFAKGGVTSMGWKLGPKVWTPYG